MMHRVKTVSLIGVLLALVMSVGIASHAWADPYQVTVTCKDGKEVQATRSGQTFVNADYVNACKGHGGYETPTVTDTSPATDTPTDTSADTTSGTTVGSGATSTAGGDGKDCTSLFFGIPAWYRGMQDDSCAFKAPETNGQADAKLLVLMIALNIVQAGMVVVAYVTVFFLIKGGFGYITSAGSSEGMASAKKTITNAIVGLIIAILAASIVNAIAGAIT